MSTEQTAGVRLPDLSVATRALLQARLHGRNRTAAPGPRPRDGIVPLSFAQERLYFLDRMQPGGSVYNVHAGVRLPGPLDVAALERALGEIVRRHEALRTTFREVGGVAAQTVAPFAGFGLAVEELAGADDEAVRRRATADAARPFDLGEGPLFRATLLRRGGDDHLLLLAMHHIVSDGWSLGVLRRELSALYDAYRAGRESPLAELPLQYADYAIWQREPARAEALDRQLAYWKRQLAGVQGLLELPTDRPRPASPSFGGGTVPVRVGAAVVDRLRALGRSEGATLYMTVLAAFQLLLSKHAGSDDVVVGGAVAGRAQREVEELIGFFANTLVLRTGLGGDPAFREALRRVRETVLGAYEHQDVPFERLVAELQPERSPGHSPLFQVMFSLGDADAGLPAGETPAVEAEITTAKFDLTLAFAADAGGLNGVLEYSTDLFDRATAERMAAQLGRVLEQVADDASRPLSALVLMDEDERRQVVETWNRTDVAYPSERSIHDLFAEQARHTPDAVAVVFEDDSLTYRELDARANRLARYLARCGVGPEVRVGICLERGPELVVAILAVLKAGGAYVPLDPGYPAARLERMLADSAAAVLVTRRSLRDALPASRGVRLVSLDEEGAEIAAGSADALESAAAAGGLAYVMFTSGSTGTPKGVGVEHRSVVRLVRGARYARFGPDEVVLQAAPVSFDASTLELWGALLNGGRLVLMPGSRPSLAELGGAIQRHGVTTLWLTAGLLQVMVDERLDDLAGVRQLLAGGDVLPVHAVARVRERFPACRLINGYGPTENTTFTCCHTVGDAWSGGPVPIGSPISNTRVYVLDAALRPVPVGVPGELCAAGDGVARGYLGHPAATAEKFVPDPFGRPGGRMYRTGDRVRWNADGVVEYLGRLDGQVKVRGFRVEPGEIEAALRGHPAVRDCVVMAREDLPGEKRLVAYVAGGAEAETLRIHLRRTLPEHMVPAAFVALDHLPLTPNGKLDRRALPAPELAPAEDRYVAPRTPVEAALAEIWAGVLGVERVGAADDFFAAGGHSLLATRVVSRVRERFGVELPLRALFERPTVAALAEAVEALRRDGARVLPPVVPIARDRPLPLSFAQERLWFLDRMEPGNTTYNMYVSLRLAGALDAGALERALSEIVRRHESLRTTFREVGGAPVQVIAPFAGFTLAAGDLSGPGEAERDAELRRRAADEAARPFDLAAGPLFRATLLRLGHQDHALLISMHHAVSDGWSLGVLHRELSALYAACRDGAPSPLAGLPVQYADYAAWQREQLAGEVLDRQLAYWTRRLAGAPALLELPTDRPRPAVQAFAGAHVPVAIPAALLERLRALGRGEGATLYMVVLAAFQLLLARHGAGDDVVVGTPVAGRTRGEVEALIGFFVNTLALRTDLSGDPDFREVLRRVRDVTLGAYEHQDLPFERLVAQLQPERSLSHAPLVQATFALEDAAFPPAALPGLAVAEIETEGEAAKLDLALALGATADGLLGRVTYRTDLFERATIERMVAHLARVLEQAAADPRVRLSEIGLLDAAERRRVVEEWSPAPAHVPTGCIHELFAAQAARTPDARAIACGGEEVAYRELDRAANRLAHHLAARGVGPEARVGIVAERAPGTVVAILAVLKAGGAWVPLDPAYPADRLAYMLADAGVRLVIAPGALPGALDGAVPAVVGLDAEAEDIAACPAWAPRVASHPDSLAYVVYTSGSTGRPKGVAVAHRGVPALAAWKHARLGQTAADRALQFASPSFDAAVEEVFGALLCGGTLVMAPREALLPGAPLRETLRRERVSFATLPPSVLALMDPADAPGLRVVVSAGEALPAAVAARWSGAVELHNAYGPTETTVCAASARVAAGNGRAPAIGRPLESAPVRVLDPAGRPVPAGVPGELYVGGAGVARGYLNRPALTAARFVPDPFSSVPGARLYRTGDRARWRADATLEYLGRTDQQVKVRGFRIEPGEIESVLAAHAAVRQARVVVREDEPGEKRLVAYVVGDAGADDLRAHLGRSLPGYMVPAAFVALPSLPLTPNGKVDEKALPAPDFESAEGRYEAPRTPAEEVLAGIWAEVLRVARAGVRDDFFALGGHSLLATRIVSRIREVFGVELPLRALFEGPTVGAMAARVEELRRAGLPLPPPVVAVEGNGTAPLSFAQRRLWFLDRMRPGATWYNVVVATRLAGPLDAAVLERALGEIVRRHAMLRTVFAVEGDEPVQRVLPPSPFRIDRAALDGVAEAERGEAERAWIRRGAERPFDLAAGPLFRAELLRVDGDAHVLLLAMHHVVSDGWSNGVLLRELGALYAAFLDGQASPLPELAVQYADYAAWQRAHLRGAVLDEQIAWWRAELAGAPTRLELPADRPRPPVQGFRGGSVAFDLAPETIRAVRALARREGATLFMALLGAFQLFLARAGGQTDVLVGTPIAGRTRRETEPLIGFFVNTLALRLDVSDDPGFAGVLARVRRASLGAYDHQDLPFERLVEELRVERDLSRSPLVQAMFALSEAGDGGMALRGVRAEPVGTGVETARFDLMLTLVETGLDRFSGVMEYAADLFDPETVARMGAQFSALLQAAAADPARPVSGLPLMDDVERRRVVREWNATDTRFAQAELSVAALVERQAARTPDAAALVFEGETLSFAEVNARANRLARRLRRLGVGAESRVGVCAERSPELVVGLLAVLKAGGAYVPLDPTYPAGRLAYMLADSGVAAVLAQDRFASLVSSAPLRVRLEDGCADEDGADLGLPIDPARPVSGLPLMDDVERRR
ncbi:MAG TPA: amino acid adenylation domain-containing protein, partial [Longimicrobium sp.]|nr:amino acid adenylation domain-containing protein [Longimicrobium sp.]